MVLRYLLLASIQMDDMEWYLVCHHILHQQLRCTLEYCVLCNAGVCYIPLPAAGGYAFLCIVCIHGVPCTGTCSPESMCYDPTPGITIPVVVMDMQYVLCSSPFRREQPALTCIVVDPGYPVLVHGIRSPYGRYLLTGIQYLVVVPPMLYECSTTCIHELLCSSAVNHDH